MGAADSSKGDAAPLSLLRAGAGGTAWLGGSQLVAQSLHVAIRLLLARLLAPEAFGLLAAAVTFTSAAGLLVDLGFGAALIQRRELDDEYSGTAFWTMLGSATVLTALLIAAAPVAGWFYRNPTVVPVLQVLSFELLLGAPAGYYQAKLSREFRFAVVGIRRILGTVVAGVLAVVAALGGWGVWVLVVYAISQSVIGTLLLAAVDRKLPPRCISLRAFQDLWAFSSPLLGARLLNYLNRNADNLLIGRFLGAASLGIYALAYQAVLMPLQYVSRPIATVAFPLFSSVSDDRTRLVRGYAAVTSLIAVVTGGLAGLIVAVAPSLVPFVLGQDWVNTVPLLQILAPAGALQAIRALSGPVLQAIGASRLVFTWTKISVVCNLTAFVWGVNYGIVPLATAFLGASVVTTSTYFGIMRSVLPFRWTNFGSIIVHGVVTGVVTGGTSWFIMVRTLGSWPYPIVFLVACIAALALGCSCLRFVFPRSWITLWRVFRSL